MGKNNPQLETSTASTIAKSQKLAYSQDPNQNKIDRQRVKIQRVRQTFRRLTGMVFRVEQKRKVGEEDESGLDL